MERIGLGDLQSDLARQGGLSRQYVPLYPQMHLYIGILFVCWNKKARGTWYRIMIIPHNFY